MYRNKQLNRSSIGSGVNLISNKLLFFKKSVFSVKQAHCIGLSWARTNLLSQDSWLRSFLGTVT